MGAEVRGGEMMDKIKTCRKCKQELPATTKHYYRQNGGKYGFYSVCISCVREKYSKSFGDSIYFPDKIDCNKRSIDHSDYDIREDMDSSFTICEVDAILNGFI